MSDSDKRQKKLTKDEQKKAGKLSVLLERLKNGEHVQNRSLKNVLTQNQFEVIAVLWKEQVELRKDLADKPDVIVEYERRFKKARFIYSRADGYSGKGCHKPAKSLFGQADTEFEKLLEYLQEIIYADPSLMTWFDRNVHWEMGDEPALCPSAMPHVITSKSLDNLGHTYTTTKLTKNQVKQQVVEDALNELLYAGDKMSSEEMDALIKDKLAKLK